jgi:hypothetical protein
LSHTAPSTTLNMIQVRCVGTEKPASAEYAPPANQPPKAPALGAATHRVSAGTCRQRKATSQYARPATMPTCRPEMDTRCTVPVARSTSHCPSGIAPASPTASAAITGPLGESKRVALM